MKRKIIFATVLVIFLSIALLTYKIKPQFFAAFLGLESKIESSHLIEESKFHNSNFFELKKTIIDAFISGEPNHKENSYLTQIGITSHHLPTALPLIVSFYKNLYHSPGPRGTFVILGPDHFEKCQAPLVTSKMPYLTPFGEVVVDEQITDAILQSGAFVDDNCFENEHSVAVQTIFIKYLFPDAKIVPIIFSANTSNKLIEQLAEILYSYKDKITVITSVDFSHYQNRDQAIKIDDESEQMLNNFDVTFLDIKHVDSPPVVKLSIALAKKFGALKSKILDKVNSSDFTADRENTTGYINAVFIDNRKSDNLINLMFVGDMMLSRQVGEKMKKLNNWQWPFEKIGDYLASADLTFGNLEGPISDQGRNVGSIYSFRADPRVIQGLKYAGFDILSLANNHIGDWTGLAMEDAFKILKTNGINYVGGGFSEEEAHSALIKEINGVKFGFLGYSAFGSKYIQAIGSSSGIALLNKEKMTEDIQAACQSSDLVIVSIHFGDEYQAKANNFQKEMAQAAIEAGASLVIGHHPHVIQEVEPYQDGWIAYSLGNFIFDQTFSKETMEGLLLKAIIEDKKIKNVEPIKIEISKDFQAEIED